MATAAVAPAYAPEDPTLPKPWTGLIDGGSGVLYYWNTETNATQYEKPAALLPQLTSMPKLAPIPAAGSQALNNNMPQHELGQQMHQQQPFQQMHNNQPQYKLNQHTQQYLPNQSAQNPSMQMNQMVQQQIPKLCEPLVTQCQGQQQQRLPGSHQAQQNGFLDDRDAMRHIGEPAGETRYPGSVSHPSTGNKNADGAFSELQHSQADANHRQQPVGGQPVANQTNHARSQPHMGQNMGYSEDQHGRGKGDYPSPGSNMMFQQQLKIANISRAPNQQGTRTKASQPIGPSHTGVLNDKKITMSRIHDHAAFSNGAPLGQSSRIFNSSASTNTSPADLYRQQHEITITGGGVPDPFMSFEATGFPPEILREILSAGFSSPTPIQAQTWPIALQSRDIVAVAKTGSGKTLGYLIPAVLHLRQCRNNPQIGPTVVVLSPTRELACQIQDEAVKFGRSSRISCTCLYGGAPKGAQLREIERGVDIVVATPGRLNDILEMKKINFSQVSFLVLDEADRMLDMGFEPQIRKIVTEIPPHRQTLMYTATWPKEVRKIAEDLLVKSVQVNIGNVELSANKSITQYVEVVPPMEKQRRLEQIIRTQERGSKIIIFCSTKRLCDQLSRTMRGYGAAAIHGDKSQGERDQVLNQFRAGKAPILVATDVAARGLDVKDIRVVINYDFPTGIEDYVHRIGRTGRAGATGIAYTFISDQDWKHSSDLVKILEGSNQHVPPQVREMAAQGASSFSRGRGGTSRWDSGGGRGMRADMWNGGGRWVSADGGRGMREYDSGGQSMRDGGGFGGRGRSEFSSGGRGNRGRGGFDRGPVGGGRGWQDRVISGRGRFDGPRRSVDWRRDRSYSRSPERVRTECYGSDGSRSRSRSCSRSRSRSRSLDRPQRVRRASGFDVPLSASGLLVESSGQETSLPGDVPPVEQ